jgi:hypothetical protein
MFLTVKTIDDFSQSSKFCSFNSESLSLPNHRSLSSSVMSDAIEMTYLDLSKRRQQQQQQKEMSVSNTTEPDAIPKNASIDESQQQQQQLTTQSSFSDISDLPIIKENTKTKTNRKVSTTTNDTNRNIFF